MFEVLIKYLKGEHIFNSYSVYTVYILVVVRVINTCSQQTAIKPFGEYVTNKGQNGCYALYSVLHFLMGESLVC